MKQSYNKNNYDIIIVGARIAGSSAAIQFARIGLKVLLLDKSQFPSDCMSTHFLYPRGLTYLHDLNLPENVINKSPSSERLNVKIEDYDLSGVVNKDVLERRFKKLHPNRSFKINQSYTCPRRFYLDKILIDKATQEGVEFIQGFEVTQILTSGDEVVGVKGKTASSERETFFYSNLLVGADGRHSIVAKTVNAKTFDIKRGGTFACFSYFSGHLNQEARIYKKDRLAYAVVPTNDTQSMVLTYGPKHYAKEFLQNKEENFHEIIKFIDPLMSEQIKDTSKRTEPFRFTADQTAFLRKTTGKGYVLIGDAACFKDQASASGMTHAFRDAALLVDCLGPSLTNGSELDSSLQLYEQKHYLDMYQYYEFSAQISQMKSLTTNDHKFYDTISSSQNLKNQFIEVYSDVQPYRNLFKSKEYKHLDKANETKFAPNNEILTNVNPIVLSNQKSLKHQTAYSFNNQDFSNLKGSNLLNRCESYQTFYSKQQQSCATPYHRTLKTFPGTRTSLVDEMGRSIEGINFASQDYLGLGSHPQIKEAAYKAIRDFGVHSAGSPMIIGNTTITQQLEAELGDLLNMKHVLIFPTGYAAGFGSILGLVRPSDYIVMDRLSHACLQQGANAATKNIRKYPHLSVEHARTQLADIRSKNKNAGILLLTEGTFSMDADSPDIRAFQNLAREFDATLFVDVAHDLGCSGATGGGQIEIQGMNGDIDLVMGSFSKSFACNGGFLATNNPAVKNYVKLYSTPHIFSNALSPVQAATALEAIRIMKSQEGTNLRNKVHDLSKILRASFNEHGHPCIGQVSPIIPVPIGTEIEARLCHKLCMDNNIAAMILEYPVVAIGETRFRLQIMANHDVEETLSASRTLCDVIKQSKELAL